MHGGGFMMGDLEMPEADWTVAGDLRPHRCGRRQRRLPARRRRRALPGAARRLRGRGPLAARQRLELGVDPTRITIGGASAGGNLAVATTLRLRDEDGWQPAALVPIYPVLHDVLPTPTPEVAAALDEVPPALRFTPEGTGFMNANYLGGHPADGYSFPTHADLAGLAPTLLVTAEYDDLRTTGEVFADQLRAAGVDVRLVQADGMLHGFLNLSSTLGPVDDVLRLMADRVVSPATQPRSTHV